MRTQRVDWYHHLPLHVKEILTTLQNAGHEAYLVGGCVRDLWLGCLPKDFDLVSSATPDEVESLFARTESVGRQFGIMIVVTESGPVEVARFRADAEYLNGRHPIGITFSNPEEDAKRRDFTINALFYDPGKGEVIDYVGGIDDLESRLLRCVGEAETRFQEDSLRMLRAVRFHAQLSAKGFKIDPTLVSSMQRLAPRLSLVSRERITQEVEKIFLSPQPGLGTFDLVLTSLWEPVFKVPPPNAAVHANFDVLGETFLLLSSRPASLPLFVAAIARWIPSWNSSSLVLTKEAKTAMDEISGLYEKLSRYDTLFRAEKKRLLSENRIFEAISILEVEANEAVQLQLDLALENRASWAENKLLHPPALLSGADLISIGFSPGPFIKSTLDTVRTAQLNEELTTKHEALELAKRLLTKSISG
jgi:poly(A) polymerase